MYPILLLLLPLCTAALIFLLPGRNSRNIAMAGTLISFLFTLLVVNTLRTDPGNTALVLEQNWFGWGGSTLSFSADGLSILLLLLTNTLLPVIVLSTYNRDINRPKAFFALMAFMQSALLGVFMAMDGLVFYIFWELALIPIYFICLIWGGEGRQRITFKFFVYTMAGSLFMLIALITLYQHTADHSFKLTSLYAAGKALPFHLQARVFWFLFVAFAIKMPVFPFHTWQPDTYTNAPTQGTMLLSGIMLKMGTFGLIRWLLPMVPEAVSFYTPIVIALSVISIVYASLIAIVQVNFKRLIAYSSIAHVGLICAGIFTYKEVAIQGALVQMFAHGINVVGLFFICDILQRNTGTDTIAELGGIRQVNPRFALLFLLVLLGSVALPLSNGFVGEFLLINGLYQYNAWFAAIGGLTVILGAVYMLRSYQGIMLGNTGKLTLSFPALQSSETILLVVLGAFIFISGVYPKILLDLSAGEIMKYITKP